MRNFFLFLVCGLLSVALSAQTVSQVRNQSTNPTYIPDGTTAKPPLCFNRSDHSFWGYAGGYWYQLSPAATYVDPDPDPNNERITSASVDPITNMLRIVEGGTIWNIPINSIMAEASISGSGTITVTNVGGVVTVSSSDPDENATNECNTSFSVLGGNLRIGDACGTLQVAVTDIAPLQVAENGLHVSNDTAKLGGKIIETTDIYTAHNPFTISDTSNSLLGCQVKRSFGFDNNKSGFGIGYLSENLHTTYEVAGMQYYDELGQENCDGTIVSHKELHPIVSNDKTYTDFRRGQITSAFQDIPNGVTNVAEVTTANTKLFSAAPSGTTEIVAAGGAGKLQASDSIYLEGGKKVYVVALDKLYVQPINTGSATVGDVLTMVGANGETEWQAASGGLGVARNGLTAVGDTVKLGGVLNEFTTIVGNAGNGITLINTDSTTYQSYLNIDETIAELRYDGAANSSRVVMKGGIAELAADSTTIDGRDKLFIITNKIAASTANNGDVLTLLDPLTGEADYTDGNGAFWRLKGNTGTDGGVTDFVGTTDAQDLVLKTNNVQIARFGQQGNAALGSDLTSIDPSLIPPVASNIGSMAFQSGQATGLFSTAFQLGVASGDASVAFGEGNTASGYLSATFGRNNVVNGNISVAFGRSNIASGNISVAFGETNTASGNISTAFGEGNTASGLNSTAFGEGNTASGLNSTAFGEGNIAPSGFETTLGLFSTNYTVANNNSDRLFTIGNGTDNTLRNNALTLWKDGRSMWNGDIAKQNTWIGVNGTNAQNFINVTTPAGSLAAISTEHTPSGNYVVLGCNAGNSGIVINDTKQLAFTTTAGTTSTNLGATNTIANYGNTGFLFGGGAAATSTLQLQGSYASNALVIAADYAATGTDHTLVCNNGATAITVTLPNPTTCIGREYRVLRYAGSTGTITVTDARGGAASVQALAGTIGVTTTITALGPHDDWSVSFKAVTVGAVTSWLRID